MGAKKQRSLFINLLALNRLQTKQQETSLMAECNELEFELPGLSGRKIEGNFEGGNVSSDGGLVLLRQVDRWICTSPDKTDTEIWLTNAVCYGAECCTAFKVASRHKRRLPTGYPPFIPFALLNYVTHSEKE